MKKQSSVQAPKKGTVAAARTTKVAPATKKKVAEPEVEKKTRTNTKKDMNYFSLPSYTEKAVLCQFCPLGHSIRTAFGMADFLCFFADHCSSNEERTYTLNRVKEMASSLFNLYIKVKTGTGKVDSSQENWAFVNPEFGM